MLDESMVEQRRLAIADRFTPEELIEALGVTTDEVFDRFTDECLELKLEDFE
jgi:hypothetical protein